MLDNVFAGLWSSRPAAIETFAFEARIDDGPLAGLAGSGRIEAPAHLVPRRGISLVEAADGMGLTLSLLGRVFDVADAETRVVAPRAALRDGAPIGLEAVFALGSLRIRIAGVAIEIVEASGSLPPSAGRLSWAAPEDATRAATPLRGVTTASAPPPGLA